MSRTRRRRGVRVTLVQAPLTSPLLANVYPAAPLVTPPHRRSGQVGSVQNTRVLSGAADRIGWTVKVRMHG
jgi:hypothetical protein